MACLEPKIVIKGWLGLLLNLLLVYLTFCPKSGWVSLAKNFWYLQNYSWHFSNINKFSLESFSYSKFETWSICPCTNCNFLILPIIYWLSPTWKKKSALCIFSTSWDGISWNIHWDFPLTDEVELLCHQLDHLSLSQKLFWYINYILITWSK